MDNFYEILDSIYKINKKHPEVRFGQIIDTLTVNNESIFYLSDEEINLRLKSVLNQALKEE